MSRDDDFLDVQWSEWSLPVLPSVGWVLFAVLDRWNLEEVFLRRVSLMRSLPRFLWDRSEFRSNWHWMRLFQARGWCEGGLFGHMARQHNTPWIDASCAYSSPQ